MNIIKYLNNYKLLEILILSYFEINSLFTIKLYNLITLKLLYCENIALSENCGLNIKTVSFCNCRFPNSNFLLKLPEVKDCQIYDCENLVIDYESLSKIKNLTIDAYYFLKIKAESLEKVKIYSNDNNTDKIEKKMIEKFLSSKTLKDISFTITKIDPNIFSQIKGINKEVTKMEICWNNIRSDCILFDLQNKFPNLLEIDIKIDSSIKSNKLNHKRKLEI